MLKVTLITLTLAIIGFAGFVAMQSSEFRVTRTATMNAEPAAVFELVNDLHKWNSWSPWAKLDPAAKNTFEGAPSGTGAILKWSGNNQIGEGIMTITESIPNELIRMKLDFVKPFKATNTTKFTFTPTENQTTVTWTMSGQNSFIGKAVSLVMDCEKMVGGQFEQGLAQMKSLVEAANKK